MPRHRGRPKERQRSSRACGSCRSSKKRCDSQLPCSNCERKGIAPSCSYPERRAGRPLCGPQTSPAVYPTDSGPPPSSRPNMPTAYPAPEARETSHPVTQHPTMLLSASGEKVYVGNTAAISFLQFLRETMRYCAGPSTFTESHERHTMLEAAVQRDSPDDFRDDLECLDRLNLIRHFQHATSGLVYLYTDDDISQLLAASSVTNLPCNGAEGVANQARLASLYLMVAIGAQCRSNQASDLRCSAKYFSQAEKMVFKDRLYNPSLGMIINFLLLAFYMFCACRRNTALMYLGVASQAATILGLHLPELNNALPPETQSLRIRTWRSLRILDLICNAILGRPSSTPSVGPEEADVDSEKNTHHRMLALNASFGSCWNIEIISQTLAKQNSLAIDTAENLLQMLRHWAQALPKELRQYTKDRSADGLDDGGRERTIGNIHVACSYYFAVILVTRQFLVATVSPILHPIQKNQTSPAGGAPNTAVDSHKISQLSQVCISAAKYLIHICHDATVANLLLGNMCILQAWVFAAGLVLGFSLVGHSDISHPHDRTVFASSRDVLSKLSSLSPQAKRYYEILSSFGEAVESYQEQLHRDRSRASDMYLEQILGLQGNSSIASSCREPLLASSSSNLATASTSETSIQPLRWLNEFVCPPPQSLALPPEVSDEIGLHLLWDEYTTQAATPVPTSNETFPGLVASLGLGDFGR